MNSLQNLVNIREEANRPILAPRIRRGGGEAHPILPPKRRRLISTPKGNVRKLVQYFEANPILQYTQPLVPQPRKKRTEIIQKRRALSVNAQSKSFEIGVKSQKDPLVQLQKQDYPSVNYLAL